MHTHSRKDEIISLSNALIRTQGCNAFSYYDLAETLHIRPSAIHYHFPQKTDLLKAVATAAENDFKAAAIQLDAAYPEEAERLRQFIRQTYQQPATEGKLCIVLALGTDYSSLSAGCCEALKATTTAITDWLSRLLKSGRLAGVFRFEGDPRVRAQLLIAMLSAALSLTRLYGPRMLAQFHKQVLTDLLVQPPAKRRQSSRKK